MSDINSIYSNIDPGNSLLNSLGNLSYTTTSSDINTLSSNVYTGNIYAGKIYNGTSAYDNYSSAKQIIYNALSVLDYNVDFEFDDKQLLKNNLKSIKNKKFTFNCNYVGNRIQPYEYIMNLIENKTKFSVKVKVSNILTICYTGVQFTKIQNNLSFSGDCNFSELKVKIKYDSVSYENHKLSEKEIRTDKLKKIINNSEL
jgi:hypothetical protein